MLNVNFMFQQKDIKQIITKWWMLQKRKYRFFKTRGQKSNDMISNWGLMFTPKRELGSTKADSIRNC